MNKITYKILAFAGIAGMSLHAMSCLDDTYTDFSAVPNVLEMIDANPRATIALATDPTDDIPDSVWVTVNAAGPNPPDHDLPVTVGINQAALDDFNSNPDNVTGVLLPDSSYSITTTSVTIIAGTTTYKVGGPEISPGVYDSITVTNRTRTAKFLVLIYANKVPATPGTNYILPIGILSAPAGYTISGNFGTILYNFYHNPYDGSYSATGTRYNFNATADYAGWDVAGDAPKAGSAIASAPTYAFPNTAANTINGDVTTIHAGNSDGGFGLLRLTTDPTTFDVTISAIQSETTLNAPSVKNVPGVRSYYDPATKTFHIYYQYQNVDADGNPTSFRVLKEVLKHN